MKIERTARTNWNPVFDNMPTSNVPRIKFSHEYSKIHVNNSVSFLEIGCGTGSYIKLVDHAGSIGVDIEVSALKVARKYCPQSEFIAASASNLPLKDGAMDVACVWGVLEEIPLGVELELISEVRRILKKNSLFLLSAYTNNMVSKIFDPAHIIRGVRHYETKALLRLLSEVGFSVTDYTIRGGPYTIMSNFLVYFYKHILHRKDGMVKKFFDKRSEVEFNTKERKGMVYIFISARKVEPS